MYSSIVGTNKRFDHMLKKLGSRIKTDLRTYEEMMKLLGAMEQIFAMITPPADEIYVDQNLIEAVDFVVE